MKKKFLPVVLAAVSAAFCALILTGCGFFGAFDGDDDDKPSTPQKYTIQYTDESGVKQLTVTQGQPYSLKVVPEKTGYTFMGLYDAEDGGTQYVTSSGSSVSPFSDGKSIVLYPQYKAKEYTVILDYQGADVTGSRQMKVNYGAELPELPKNLSLEHKDFTGWYTEPDCGGVAVADKYGLVPLVSIINEQNFDIDSSNITLYAGFAIEKHAVTFHFGAGIENEVMQVEYDTPIRQVVPKTRVENKAVLTWSKAQDGDVWNGKVTSDMDLYAVEYAPVIELDVDGGKDVTPVVARPGDVLSLPVPEKDLAKFLHWCDMNGDEYTATHMPENSISLRAIWQAKIVFDENGGSDVNDISQSAGTTIDLPAPEKEGYIFAGWYTQEKERYTSTKMPTSGIALKAGWYAAKQVTKIYRSEDNSDYITKKQQVDLTALDSANNFSGELYIKADVHIQIKQYSLMVYRDEFSDIIYGFYNDETVSPATKLMEMTFPHQNRTTYQLREFTTTVKVVDGKFWIIVRETNSDAFSKSKDYFITFTYPQTTKLYL